MRRRQFLDTLVGGVTAGFAALAGCQAGGSPETVPGTEYPTVDEWLTETDVGSADETYDGELLDRRGDSEVRIDVGSGGNGGTSAYDPSGVVVSPGTTVRWVWVDDREMHNVVADPDRQLGESDYEFRSGGPVTEKGNEFTMSLDREGVALYHCEGISGATQGRRREPAGATRLDAGGGQSPAPGLTAGRATSGRSPPLFHLEPHLSHGMKGGIAVTE